MTKTVRIVLLLVVAGAAVNIAVAWACSLRSNLGNFDPHVTARLRSERWEREAEAPELRDAGRWIESVWSGPGLDLRVEYYDEPPNRVTSYRSGWPFLALGAAGVTPNPNPDLELPSYRWGARLPEKMTLRVDYLPGRSAWGGKNTMPRVIPFGPLWPGFAVNTMIYAAAIGILWLAGRSALRQVRRWRGRCPGCGYDLRRDLSGGCSECGWRRAGDASEGSFGVEDGP